MRKSLVAVAVVAAVAVAVLAFHDWRWDISLLEDWIKRNPVLGGLAYVGIFIASTILPITSLPLLPLAARAYGVTATFFLSTAGWWLGCLIAFQMARWGRPFLDRVASAKAIARCERAIADRQSFWAIVVLRILFPGDFVAFTMGLVRSVRFATFAAASLVGTLPSAIVASYAGGEVGQGRYISAALVAVAMIAAVLIVRARVGKPGERRPRRRPCARKALTR